MEQITVKQALEQGYKYYFINNNDNFQRYCSLDDIKDNEIEDNYILASKEPSFIPCVDSDDIIDFIKDRLEDRIYDEVSDDDIYYLDEIDKIDFTEIVNKINSILLQGQYHSMTDIKLIKENE